MRWMAPTSTNSSHTPPPNWVFDADYDDAEYFASNLAEEDSVHHNVNIHCISGQLTRGIRGIRSRENDWANAIGKLTDVRLRT